MSLYGLMSRSETELRVRQLASMGLRTGDIAGLFNLHPKVVKEITEKTQSPDAQSVPHLEKVP